MKWRLTLRKSGKQQVSIRMSEPGIDRSGLSVMDRDRVLAMRVGDTYIDADDDVWVRTE